MIQFNLLPDVKIAFIKAERQKRLVMSISLIASIAAISIFVILSSFVYVVQKKSINDLSKDIKSKSSDLVGTKDLNKILTIQNQVGALDNIHNNKIVASRSFDYIQQVTPSNVSLKQTTLDFTANTIEIEGGSSTLAAINTYADSLKFTKFTTKGDSTQKNAFSNVVLSDYAVSPEDHTIRYTINAGFDSALFAQKSQVNLVVPSMITTRSYTEHPEALFNMTKVKQ